MILNPVLNLLKTVHQPTLLVILRLIFKVGISRPELLLNRIIHLLFHITQRRLNIPIKALRIIQRHLLSIR
jgi:hypothetical protein